MSKEHIILMLEAEIEVKRYKIKKLYRGNTIPEVTDRNLFFRYSGEIVGLEYAISALKMKVED